MVLDAVRLAVDGLGAVGHHLEPEELELAQKLAGQISAMCDEA